MPIDITYVHQLTCAHQLHNFYQKVKAFIINRAKVCAEFQSMVCGILIVWENNSSVLPDMSLLFLRYCLSDFMGKLKF